MLPLINMGGVILTGDKMALGRGRSLEVFIFDICTGPPTSLVSIASSSELLEESEPVSPDSLPLDELEVLEREEELRW